jgi:hypothetical protein
MHWCGVLCTAASTPCRIWLVRHPALCIRARQLCKTLTTNSMSSLAQVSKVAYLVELMLQESHSGWCLLRLLALLCCDPAAGASCWGVRAGEGLTAVEHRP